MSRINENEKIDEIGFGNKKLIQATDEFKYGVDSVLIADFLAKNSKNINGVRVKKDLSVVDLGTGSGVIPIILSHKIKDVCFIGIEVQKASANRALRSVTLNNLEDRIKIICADIKNLKKDFPELKGGADAVVTNPPYMENGGAITNDSDARTIARHETTAKLEDFFEAASFLLQKGGELFMVHRTYRFADVICLARKYELEPKTMRLVAPNAEKAPNIVLLQFIKGAGKELKILPQLSIYDDKGRYTREVLEIYEKK